jgi:hypothetical protein
MSCQIQSGGDSWSTKYNIKNYTANCRAALIGKDYVGKDYQLIKNSNWGPFLGDIGIVGGVRTWRLQVDGSNSVLMGMSSVAYFDKECPSQGQSPHVWCFSLKSRKMYFAGKPKVIRQTGPEDFQVPCIVEVTFDADEGTLSVVVDDVHGSHSLGVLCSTLPRNQPLFISAGTGSNNCSVAILEEGMDEYDPKLLAYECHKRYVWVLPGTPEHTRTKKHGIGQQQSARFA